MIPVPLIVVDRHNDALRHFLPCAPVDGGVLVHLDSHGDMGCTGLYWERGAPPQHRHSEVGTWVLPLVLSGHVSHIVWLQPPWVNEMEAGTYALVVGARGTRKGRQPVVVGPRDPSGDYDGCRTMWELENAWVGDVRRIQRSRAFDLHVFRLSLGGPTTARLPAEQAQRWQRLLLDPVPLCGPIQALYVSVDADFWSCANTMRVAVTRLFGEEIAEACGRYGEWLHERRWQRRKRQRGPTPEAMRRPPRRWYETLGMRSMGLPDVDELCRHVAGGVHHVSTAAEVQSLTRGVRDLLPVEWIRRVPQRRCVLAHSLTGGFLPSSEAPYILWLIYHALRYLWPGRPLRCDGQPAALAAMVLPHQRSAQESTTLQRYIG